MPARAGSSVHVDVTRAMARGLRRGDGGAHLITFHPPGGSGSSTWFHNDDWLDFNMRQNGRSRHRRHGRCPDESVPGTGRYHLASTRDTGGSYAMVYAPAGRTFSVKICAITGPSVKAWWFNPRNGAATPIGTFAHTGERAFTPPDAGEMLDWVLVLDDEAKGYPAPGARATPK